METKHEAINVALTIENGVVINVRQIRENEFTASLDTFFWLAKRAGYKIIPPHEHNDEPMNAEEPAEVE